VSNSDLLMNASAFNSLSTKEKLAIMGKEAVTISCYLMNACDVSHQGFFQKDVNDFTMAMNVQDTLPFILASMDPSQLKALSPSLLESLRQCSFGDQLCDATKFVFILFICDFLTKIWWCT